VVVVEVEVEVVVVEVVVGQDTRITTQVDRDVHQLLLPCRDRNSLEPTGREIPNRDLRPSFCASTTDRARPR
jgi:hypothetical protein